MQEAVYFTLAALVVWFLGSWRPVPRNYYGLGYVLGRSRPDWVVDEGWTFVPLFFTYLRCYSYKTHVTPIQIAVQSNEGGEESIEIIVTGHVEWYPDRRNLGRYRRETDESITTGLANAVKQELNIIAGKTRAFDFIQAKDAILQIVNSILRLGRSRQPHLNPFVATEDRLEYYCEHREEVDELLAEDEEQEIAGGDDGQSPIERSYGIVIREFKMADVDYSDEMKRAFAAKAQARYSVKGLMVTDQKKRRIAAHWKKLGVSPDKAADEAGLAVGQGTKTIISIPGVSEAAKAFGEGLGNALRGGRS